MAANPINQGTFSVQDGKLVINEVSPAIPKDIQPEVPWIEQLAKRRFNDGHEAGIYYQPTVCWAWARRACQFIRMQPDSMWCETPDSTIAAAIMVGIAYERIKAAVPVKIEPQPPTDAELEASGLNTLSSLDIRTLPKGLSDEEYDFLMHERELILDKEYAASYIDDMAEEAMEADEVAGAINEEFPIPGVYAPPEVRNCELSPEDKQAERMNADNHE